MPEHRTVKLFDLNYGEEEQKAAVETLESKWISLGPKTHEFEEKFAKAHNAKFGIAVANCTAALHLALRILGVDREHEVIVPSLTFVATASSVKMQGATPVFADITSESDWTISVADIESKITPQTKAIIAMHYGGHGADMTAICDLAKNHNLSVVEDACHAPLGIRDGRNLGTFGDFACYSFYSNKNMATGEGGMMLTNNEEFASRARLLRAHGMTSTAYDRQMGKEFYDVVDWGYNYRIDDIRSAIGIVQLGKLENDLRVRKLLVDRYVARLGSSSRIKIPFLDYPGESSNYVFGVTIEGVERPKLRDELKSRGIETSMHYPPVHLFGCYQRHSCSLPLTEKIGASQVSLPLHSLMSKEDVDYVCDNLLELLDSKFSV